MPKMPGGDDGEKKEESAESREEAKEQVGTHCTALHYTALHCTALHCPGAAAAAGDQGQGEGADPVLPEAARGRQGGADQDPGEGRAPSHAVTRSGVPVYLDSQRPLVK
jgi:hypothetical protein